MKICVFCGGYGTRMWPLSRRKNPKQFQPLIVEKSLFQLMIERLKAGFDLEDIYVAVGKEYENTVRKQISKLPRENLILEPEMRDTLGAVGFAATFLQKKFPNEVMAAIWGADHIVKKGKEFIKALKVAEKLARDREVIVKVDVRPTSPNVHLGYVQTGKKIDSISGFSVFEFKKHVEKPRLNKAKGYLESGNYLWNTGYFVWKLSTITRLYEKHVPEVFRTLKRVQSNLFVNGKEKEIAKEFSKIPKISIDYALFEKLQKEDQLVIEASLGWTDIGAWGAFKDELAENKGANVVKAHHVGIDTRDSLIFGPDQKKLIATIGLKDVIVVDTEDVLLICPADRSQDIKKIVEKLEKERKGKYL